MNLQLQATAILRQRGQLTIPDEVRNFLKWLVPNSVVTVSVNQDDSVVIKPYAKNGVSKIDWKNIWERISIADSFWGKKGNLSQFIIEDRDKRR